MMFSSEVCYVLLSFKTQFSGVTNKARAKVFLLFHQKLEEEVSVETRKFGISVKKFENVTAYLRPNLNLLKELKT